MTKTQNRPNILFLFSDQHRGDWMPYKESVRREQGMDSLPLSMNNMKRLMDGGTTFTRNVSSSPLCVPARACLASGMFYDRCEVYNNDFCYPLKKPTFYKVLKDGGYEVCGVGKFDLHKPIFYWGTDGWIDQLSELGFTDAIDSEGKYDLLWSSFHAPRGPYAQFLSQNGLLKEHAKDYIRRYLNANDVEVTPLPEYAYADNWVSQNALEKLKGLARQEKPWFLMVNFSGPHNPWDVTASMKDKVKGIDFPIPKTYSGDSDTLNAVRQNYAAMLENIDENIGAILNELKATGQYDNTVIIYSSDHGEMLGDHDRYMKSVPYRGSVHIPLVISGPGVSPGKVCDELVQLHDLAATIVDFAGMEMPAETDSCSLKGLTCDENASPIRTFQMTMLYNSVRHAGGYEGYTDLEMYKKIKSDKEYIEEFNSELKLDATGTSMTKYYYHGDWKSIITKDYKLILFEDAEPQLYDLRSDPDEMDDIAKNHMELVNELTSLYKFKEVL